jgi:hypothetical protein
MIIAIYESADGKFIAKVYDYNRETGEVTFQRVSKDGRAMAQVLEVMDQDVFEVAFPGFVESGFAGGAASGDAGNKKFPWAILIALGTAYMLLS